MAHFAWLDAIHDAEWRDRPGGWCLKQMKWAEFCRRADEHEPQQLVRSFRSWAEHHPHHNYALTWDQPVGEDTAVYVCKTRSKVLAERSGAPLRSANALT